MTPCAVGQTTALSGQVPQGIPPVTEYACKSGCFSSSITPHKSETEIELSFLQAIQ